MSKPKKLANFTPVQDWIVIDPIEGGMSEGGIALPDTLEPDMPHGIVVAIGPGKITEYGVEMSMDVNLGDHVHVYTTTKKIEIGHHPYLVARSDTVIGVEV